MIPLEYFLIPVLGFFIGSFTNYIAIKMLFHPKKKTFGMQGLLIKRKKTIAKRIGEVSPKIMPSGIEKLKDLPIIGNKVLNLFKKSVENQINSLDNDELEKIILQVMKKEMSFVVWIGGIIGFLIGIIQVLISI